MKQLKLLLDKSRFLQMCLYMVLSQAFFFPFFLTGSILRIVLIKIYDLKYLNRMIFKIASYTVIIGIRNTMNLKVKIEGEIPKNRCLILSEHQSSLETGALCYLLKNPKIIAKRELIFYPPTCFAEIAASWILVDRKKPTLALKRIVRSIERESQEDENFQVVLFPQGTRRTSGSKPSYNRGGYLMIRKKFKMPVVPVVLNSGLFVKSSRGNAFPNFKPGVVTIKFLPQIEYEHNEDLNEFANRVENLMEKETAFLEQEVKNRLESEATSKEGHN